MGLRICVLSCLLAPCFVFASASQDTVKQRMLRDIDFIYNTFAVKYAPVDWKQRYADWDLTVQIEKAKRQLLLMDEVSIKAYQRILREFVQSTKDYHVGVSFWSTENATLPFRVCGASGRYYITAIDRPRLPSRSFPFDIGDELLLFDGRPADEVVQELKQIEVGDASPATDQSLAEIYLTTRSGSLGQIVPRGPVHITIRSAKTGIDSSYQICWDYQRESIKEPPLATLSPPCSSSQKASSRLASHPFFQRKMLLPLFEAMAYSAPLNGDLNDLGGRESFVPVLGKKIWRNNDEQTFEAYIFQFTRGRKVGYVRIPHYTGGAVEVEDFERVIAHLEKNTDALVIDQVNNPGGSVFYLYGLLSHLTEKPLYTPKHRMTITQEDVFFALQFEKLFELIESDHDARSVLGDSMEGYPVNYQTSQFILNYFRFIIDEWDDGRLLTRPYYLWGVDCINPNPGARYTKPILLLVNQLCFSGGDFLPAILQDNERVTIFGTKTAGAGGYVDGCTFHNPFGVAGIFYTASIAERINNNPIENLGVTPDICYDLTEEDIKDQCVNYKRAVSDALEDLLRG